MTFETDTELALTTEFDWRRFATCQSGAVTTDWIVLGAATLALGATTVTALRTGTTELALQVTDRLTTANVETLGAQEDDTADNAGDDPAPHAPEEGLP